MYKVIVVDDETWICKLIRKIVNWQDLGFEIIADASDGLAALNLIKEHRPDLVITDIRMPSLDGIELIKTAREHNIDAEFMIISGYSDFEYARDAIKYDAFGYIVKPLDRDELQEMLLSVKEKISKKHQIKTRIEYSDSQLLENEIKKIINHQGKSVGVEELNSQFGTHFTDDELCVVVFKQDFISKETLSSHQKADYQHYLSGIKETILEYINEAIWYIDTEGAKGIFIFNYAQRDNLKRGLTHIMAAYQQEKRYKDQIDLTIGMGETVTELGKIRKSFHSAMSAIYARMVLGTGRIIDAQKEIPSFKHNHSFLDLHNEKRLSAYFDVFDILSASEEISSIFRKADRELLHDPAAYHTAAAFIIGILFKIMEEKHVHLGHTTKDMADLYIENCLSKIKIETYLNQIINEFEEIYSESKQDGNDKVISEIRAYIIENYMSDIRLEDVAKLVCLNPTYVSEVFKKKTGENFIDYLSDYRIDVAKELLKNIRYKVIDVSAMVGYKDSKYFSRLFKKKVGVNPTDYRNLHI